MVPQISLNDYDGLNGFGTSSTRDVNELSKALSAGYAVANQTGGASLRVESLESSLKVVTYGNRHIKLWKKIPKSPAYSTVEEYNVLSSYGNERSFGFTREGEIPANQDSSYTRQTALVKFIGTTRSVTHPMTLVNPAHGDVIALENQNGILWLLERVEDSLFHGNSDLAFDGEAEQWDGLDSLISSSSVVDLEGDSLQESDIEAAANLVIEAYGYPTDMFLGTRTMSDLVKTFYPRERVQLPAPKDGQVGLGINSMMTTAGSIEFNPDVFIQPAKSPPALATSANAPATPAAPTAAAGAAGTADWEKLLGAGAPAADFGYAVTAVNRFGESAPAFIANNYDVTAGEIAAGNATDLTINNPAAIGANPPEYFIVYRTNAIQPTAGAAASTNVADYSEIGRIAASSQAAAGTTVFSDTNLQLPFTSTAYLGELTPSVLTFRQLAPLMRMDLAVLAPAYRWMILMYGTPVLFAPAKFVRMINIGKLT
ncbi:MAG: hypothetical protein CMF11_06640 [Idiomarina sp.]|nr:hypothetical protein [Idiomarina sp.]